MLIEPKFPTPVTFAGLEAALVLLTEFRREVMA